MRRCTPTAFERTRAFVKIQDGCEHYCSYCIIPYARGFNRSKSLEDLKLELYDLSAKGYKEVVLVGIDLSSYGKDIGCHLVDAVTMACTTEGIERVRLGSLEPLMLTDQNLSIPAGLPNFCPQFHLSLQSGCDATLKRMNRHYDTAFYRDLVQRIRSRFDNPSITTDLMVGFPGETQEEFEQSLDFAREIGFAKVHVFAYSIRPGTRAAKMPDQLTRQQKEQRSHQMAQVTEESRKSFLQSQWVWWRACCLKPRNSMGCSMATPKTIHRSVYKATASCAAASIRCALPGRRMITASVSC